MISIIELLAGWFALSIPVGLLTGRFIAYNDKNSGEGDD